MSSILLWMPTPIRGYRIEALGGQRETDGRGWLLEALRMHTADDYDGLWKLLDDRLVSGRRAVVELVEGLLDLHASLARARGCEELFAKEKAAGYRLLLPTVDDLVDQAIRELGPALPGSRDTGELIELRWACGSVLRFERGPSGLWWKDTTAELVAEIERAAEEVSAAPRTENVGASPTGEGSDRGSLNEGPAPSAPPSTSRVEADNSMATEAAPEASACSPEVTHAQPAGPAPIHDQEEVLDPGLALKETLRLARVELVDRFAEQGREIGSSSGRCVLCASGIDLEPCMELASEAEGDRVVAHLACVKGMRAKVAPPAPPAPSLPQAAAELRRLHVLARARAAAEQVLATSEHRTFWEVLAESPLRRMPNQWMCAACALGGAGEEAHVRAPGPDGVAHAIHPRCARKAIENEPTIYGTGAQMRAWLIERGVQPGPVRVGALEAACLAFRRAQDVLSIEWASKKARTAKRKTSPCCLCDGEVAIGQRYLDGGKGKAAHPRCAGVELAKEGEAAA